MANPNQIRICEHIRCITIYLLLLFLWSFCVESCFLCFVCVIDVTSFCKRRYVFCQRGFLLESYVASVHRLYITRVHSKNTNCSETRDGDLRFNANERDVEKTSETENTAILTRFSDRKLENCLQIIVSAKTFVVFECTHSFYYHT